LQFQRRLLVGACQHIAQLPLVHSGELGLLRPQRLHEIGNMKRTGYILFGVIGVIATQASASGTIYYGSRVGMEVTVVSMSGLDTAQAIIRTKHTRENAEKFCRDYENDTSEDCIEKELGIPLNDEIHANCLTGVFDDFQGNTYRFEGNLTKKSGFSANYALRNLSGPRKGELANGDSASGYPTNMGIFKALCPLKAPFDTDWYPN
jgi:hypothetical protein